jgi:hypothetical protein
VSFESWAPNQPDSFPEEDCLGAIFDTAQRRTWRDRVCTETFPFACEGADNAPEGCELVDFGRPVSMCATPAAFDDAQATCESVGGSLLRPRNADENDRLFTEAVARFTVPPNILWLGARDAGDNNWSWLDGDPLFAPVYSPWLFGTTPIGGERDALDCLQMQLEAGDTIGRWGDASCDAAAPFVCEGDNNAAADVCTPVETATRVFLVCNEPLVFAEAALACEQLGGALARVDTVEENDAIAQAATALGVDAYLGGSDAAEEGLWTWPDGTVFDDLR